MIIFDIFAIRDPGRVKDINEDYYGVVEPEEETVAQEKGRLFVVADGMGADGAGEVASRIAVDVIKESYYSGEGGDDIADSLRYAVMRAHETIYRESQQKQEYYKMGATVTAMVIRGENVAIAHVGDTRAYVIRRGKIQQLTNDHNWAGEQLRKGTITKVHAETHPRRKVLTRWLGQAPEIEVDIYEDTVEPNDIFFLCSDGLYDTLSEEEIQKALLETNPEMAARELVARANRNGGADNITAIVVKTVFEGRPFLDKEPKKFSLPLKIPWNSIDFHLPKFKYPLPIMIGALAGALAIIIGGLSLFFSGPEKPSTKKQTQVISTTSGGIDSGKSLATVNITTAPAGANVKIDGNLMGPSPIQISLAPGLHKIEISKDGFQTKLVDLTIKEGEKQIPLNYLLVPNPSERSPDMIFIPAGYFIMGREGASPEEAPSHKIYLDAYYIDRYEVSNEQYRQFVESTGHKPPAFWNNPAYSSPKMPVVGVTWADADAYCRWNNKRLPTEAEWEKAARGTDGFIYPWGNSINLQNANISGETDGFAGLAPVDSFENGKSPFGVYNMVGNVAEWIADYYDPAYYRSIPLQNPKGPPTADRKVVRGGSFRTSPQFATTTYRSAFSPNSSRENIGFRCAKN